MRLEMPGLSTQPANPLTLGIVTRRPLLAWLATLTTHLSQLHGNRSIPWLLQSRRLATHVELALSCRLCPFCQDNGILQVRWLAEDHLRLDLTLETSHKLVQRLCRRHVGTLKKGSLECLSITHHTTRLGTGSQLVPSTSVVIFGTKCIE